MCLLPGDELREEDREVSGIDLSKLNDEQRKIVTTLDEPLFVEAGAGSGKTFTLTRRDRKSTRLNSSH